MLRSPLLDTPALMFEFPLLSTFGQIAYYKAHHCTGINRYCTGSHLDTSRNPGIQWWESNLSGLDSVLDRLPSSIPKVVSFRPCEAPENYQDGGPHHFPQSPAGSQAAAPADSLASRHFEATKCRSCFLGLSIIQGQISGQIRTMAKSMLQKLYFGMPGSINHFGLRENVSGWFWCLDPPDPNSGFIKPGHKCNNISTSQASFTRGDRYHWVFCPLMILMDRKA